MFWAEKRWDGSLLPEMKPCPFCGGEAGMLHKGNDHTKRVVTVRCKVGDCCQGIAVGALRNDFAWCEDTAVRRWNERKS